MCEKKNTGCDMACAALVSSDRDQWERATTRQPDCFTASKPDFDQEGDDPRLDFSQAQQQQHIPIHRVPDCDLDAKRPVEDREAGGIVLGGEESQQQG